MTEPRDDTPAAGDETRDVEPSAKDRELTTGDASTEPEAGAPSARGDRDHAEDGALRALEPNEIRARRRPRAVLFVWAWELACAFLIATPIHSWAKSVWGAHPDGDAVLFRPGGHALLSWLGDEGPALGIVFRTTIVALAVFGVLGQIITGALVASLATGVGKSGRAPSIALSLRAGCRAFFPLMGVGVVAGALEGSILGIGLAASSAADHALQISLGDARAFTARLAVLAVFAGAALIVGIIADIARVAVARDIALAGDRPASMLRSMRDGVVTAATTARRAVGRATLAWGWRAALSLALIWVGARAGDVAGGRGGGALWLLFAFHQLVILARAGLRASWLANALRLVGR